MGKPYIEGPWGWVYDGSSTYSIGDADDPQGTMIASVRDRNDERATVICNLLAAAPDLLAALTITRGQWIHSVNADLCLAALAKAEGRQG